MLKKMIIALSMLTLVGCSDKESEQERVEVKMTEVLENGKEKVVEPLKEAEIDVRQYELALKKRIATLTRLKEEDIALSLLINYDAEPVNVSCTVVLPTESTIEKGVVDRVVKDIMQKVLDIGNVTISEKNIVITNAAGDLLH